MPPLSPPPIAPRPLPRKRVPVRAFAISLTALLMLAIGVFLFLPDYATKRLTESPATRQAPLSSIIGRPSAPTDERVSAERRRAHAARGEWLSSRTRLEPRRVSSWASSDYAAVNGLAAQGDGAFRTGDFGAAATHYRQAVALLEHLERRIPAVLAETLEAGERALTTGDAAAARQAFHLALALAPQHAGARRGLARAESLEETQHLLAVGEAHERAGRFPLAYTDFETAVRLNPDFAPAQAALARIKAIVAEAKFQSTLSKGFTALQAGRFQEALAAFRAAEVFKPNSPEIGDGMAQATEGLRLAKIEALRQQAVSMEQQERWADALAAYQAALAIDDTLAFAQQGSTRSRQLESIHARLEHYLEQPSRLTSTRVYGSARAFLEEATALPQPGPKLRAKVARLQEVLALAGTSLTLDLRSDDATEVVIYQVGALGRFTSRKIALRPGTYTLVGSRPGYRDVRRILTLNPGEPPAPVYIACEEPV